MEPSYEMAKTMQQISQAMPSNLFTLAIFFNISKSCVRPSGDVKMAPMKSKLVLALSLALRVPLLQAGSLVNGSFEAATNGSTLSYISLSPGSTNIPGWTTTNAEITLDGPSLGISPKLTSSQGNDFLDLTGTHDSPPYGAVFQTITTKIGQPYQVSFDVGSDKYWDSYFGGTFTAPIVSLSLNGQIVFSATNDFPALNDYWQTWSFDFTAATTNTTLMFTGANPSQLAYIGLDNVVVTGLVIVLNAPAIAHGQAEIPFTLTNGTTSTFELLQSPQLTGPWTTNLSAQLMTNIPNVSYTFTVPITGPDEFYRVQSP
jgi:hypothetical protein